MKYFFLITILILFQNCSDPFSSKDYRYLDKYEALDIGYPYGSMVYKSKNKNSFQNIIVYSDVVEFEYDDNYILILQIPNEKNMILELKDDLKFWKEYYECNKKDSLIKFAHGEVSLSEFSLNYNIEKKADSIFNNNDFYQRINKRKENFYIIDKSKDIVLGPFDKNEFQKQKQERDIKIDLSKNK